MSIGISSSTSPAAPVPPPLADNSGKLADPAGADSKTRLNASILEATFSLSTDAETRSLALLFRTAIDNINELLKPELGENAIQNAASQDNTPSGTAGRIVALSTGFLEAYRKQHPGEDADEVLKNFMATIRRGFEQGLGEARHILSGLGVLGGEIASNIEKTYELVLKGYADFEAAHSSSAPRLLDEAA